MKIIRQNTIFILYIIKLHTKFSLSSGHSMQTNKSYKMLFSTSFLSDIFTISFKNNDAKNSCANINYKQNRLTPGLYVALTESRNQGLYKVIIAITNSEQWFHQGTATANNHCHTEQDDNIRFGLKFWPLFIWYIWNILFCTHILIKSIFTEIVFTMNYCVI